MRCTIFCICSGVLSSPHNPLSTSWLNRVGYTHFMFGICSVSVRPKSQECHLLLIPLQKKMSSMVIFSARMGPEDIFLMLHPILCRYRFSRGVERPFLINWSGSCNNRRSFFLYRAIGWRICCAIVITQV